MQEEWNFRNQLKVYEGSIFPGGVSFHHSFTANFSNVLNVFMKMYIFDIKMKPSGLGCSRVVECVPSMLRAKGLASALHKEKKCNLRNEKLRPNIIFFGTKRQNKLPEHKLENSTPFKHEVIPLCL